jgi:DNA mismatch endonuclease (patch repair protein)
MIDSLSPEHRSRLMARVRQKHTKPELVVRRMLHASGWRYRLHSKALPGTPDIVFPRHRAVLFVHGCFWHGHECKLSRIPNTRPEFWSAKIAENKKRDARKVAELSEEGWRVMTVWQCALKDTAQLHREMESFLRGDSMVAESRGRTSEEST